MFVLLSVFLYVGSCESASKFGQYSFLFHVNFPNILWHTLVGSQQTPHFLIAATVCRVEQFTWPGSQICPRMPGRGSRPTGLVQALVQAPEHPSTGLPALRCLGAHTRAHLLLQASRLPRPVGLW